MKTHSHANLTTLAKIGEDEGSLTFDGDPLGGGGASAWADLTDKATADLPADNGPLATALGTDATISYAASLTTDAAALGPDALLRMTMTGAVTVNAPTNPLTRQRITYFLTSDGSSRTVSLHAAISVDPAFTFDGVTPATKTRILVLERVGSVWHVTRNQVTE